MHKIDKPKPCTTLVASQLPRVSLLRVATKPVIVARTGYSPAYYTIAEGHAETPNERSRRQVTSCKLSKIKQGWK